MEKIFWIRREMYNLNYKSGPHVQIHCSNLAYSIKAVQRWDLGKKQKEAICNKLKAYS